MVHSVISNRPRMSDGVGEPGETRAPAPRKFSEILALCRVLFEQFCENRWSSSEGALSTCTRCDTTPCPRGV
jgi:hypothetical protein